MYSAAVIVFHTKDGRRFHKIPDCVWLRRRAKEVLEDELMDVAGLRPCPTCYPDAPQQDAYYRPWCYLCGSSRPCRHNGGVLVQERLTDHRYGREYEHTRWVWPDSPVLLARDLQAVVE